MIMLILALLGATTLSVVTQSGNFEQMTRNLDAERAFYLAESGAEWMLQRLVSDFDNVNEGQAYEHTLSYGQYSVLYRDRVTSDPPGTFAVESTGYYPSISNYRAKRL